MKVSAGVVFLIIWVTFVSEARLCPVNCQVFRNPSLPKCSKDTGTCSRGCISGYYGNTCNMTCDDNCQEGTCQQQDGFCNCRTGYTSHNGSCDPHIGVKCESNDHCLNNICVSASRQDCLEGCKPGWFGKFCDKPCSLHCVCDDVTGNCTSCTKGWYGAECGSSCSLGCVDKNCHRNGTCVNNCIRGSYGDACDQKCSKHCVSGCDQLSGDCVQCEAGRYGSTCQSECSARCAGADNDCDRDGRCSSGCRKGFYGEKCDFCPQQCFGDSCDVHGTCTACKKGFFGTSCNEVCLRCKDGVCNKITGECIKGCDSGFYGSFCNLTCEDCTGGDCDRATGECKYKENPSYIIGGSALFLVFVLTGLTACCLKRIQGVVYNIEKRRRGPDSAEQDVRTVAPPGDFELEEQVTINARRVCPSVPIRQTSYIEPRHSGNFGNFQLQAAGVSEQQNDGPQWAAAPPSDRVLRNVQRRSDEWSERPDSYVSPHYCEVNEEGMATPPQPTQGAQASTSVVTTNLFSVAANVHATRGDIWIPPIAECFGLIGTEDSSPDLQPLVENYDHLNRKGVSGIGEARASSNTQDGDEVRTSQVSSGQISTARTDSYIEPRHSGCIVPSAKSMLSAGVSDQQEDEPKAAVAPPSDDAMVAYVPQSAQGAEATAHGANSSSLSVIADVHINRKET